MLVQVKPLLYWKTEHGSASNCQDSLSYDPAQGLFAAADGAGTSLFPALWARILAQHFITTPLMSDDPFEVEWWVRLAQKEYKQQVPNIHKTGAWNVIQKVRNQGSDSTLATLRVTKVDAATADATLLVFGDSCVLIGDPGEQTVSSFILQSPSEFDRAPICVPSDLKYLNRDFHRCQTKDITLHTSDQVIIATDAVARWILGHGADVWAAFQQVYQCPTLDDWYTLVNAKRQAKEMVNDDSTALVLTFYEDGAGAGTLLGCINEHTEEITAQRKQAFEEAVSSNNKELLAISYGDGNDLRSVTTTPPLDTIDIADAREVADALKEVLRAFRLAQNSPDLVQKVKPFWDKYGHILQDEPCAANLRETLRNNGIIRSTPAPVIPLVQTPALTANASQIPIPSNNIPTPPSGPETPIASLGRSEHKIDPALAETIITPSPKTSQPSADPLIPQKQRDPEFERSQRELRFHRAWYEKNEEGIVSAYEELQREGDQETLARIDPNDRQNIERMIQRRTAQAQLKSALQQGTSPQKLLKAYHAAQQTDPSLTLSQPEQDLLKLAQEFVNTWGTNDLYALTKAYRNINQSGFKVHFEPEEMARITQAESTVQKQKYDLEHTIIAKVGQRAISLSIFISVYIIKQMYIPYRIRVIESQSSSSSSAKASKATIDQLRQQIKSDALPRLVLEEMVEGILIHHAIKDVIRQDEVWQREITQLAENLQQHEADQPNPDFRRHNMGIEELKYFALMVTERDMFSRYLEAQRKPPLWVLPLPKQSVLDDWLQEEKEKRKKHIFFAETEIYDDVNPRRILMILEQHIKNYVYTSI